MDRMTPEQAAALLERMDDLTTAVRATDDQVEKTRQLAAETAALAEETHGNATKMRRGFRIALIVGALLFAGMGYAVQETRQNAKQSCLNANETRAAQRAHWSFFFEVTIAGNPDAPPAVLEFYDAYVTWLTEDLFADRDCDNPDKKYEIGDPPSYEEALKAALEDEAREK
jgi:hypothetical protein